MLLREHMMLAAPVLALGLLTLVLLNMSDLMEARGGHIDALKLGLGNRALRWLNHCWCMEPAFMLFRLFFTSKPTAPPPSRSRCRCWATPPAPTPDGAEGMRIQHPIADIDGVNILFHDDIAGKHPVRQPVA